MAPTVSTPPTKSPRAMLALIALAGLPTPTVIRFVDGRMLVLDLDTVGDGLLWSRYLGGRSDSYISASGRRHLREGVIDWHGWRVQILAIDPPGEPDANQVSALEVVAEDRGEPDR